MGKEKNQTLLVIGDLHFSDVYRGAYKDYWSHCEKTMRRLSNKIKELNPDVTLFLGDLVGVSEVSLKKRTSLLQVCQFFSGIKNCMSVVGNHDLGVMTDFKFMEALNLYETSRSRSYIDLVTDKGEVVYRGHLIDYGKECDTLDIKEGCINVGFAHNEFVTSTGEGGVATHKPISLWDRLNFKDLNKLIVGHVHDVMPKAVYQEYLSNARMGLQYLGSPTRPGIRTQQGDFVWLYYVTVEGGEVKEQLIPYTLEDKDELMLKKVLTDELLDTQTKEDERKVLAEHVKEMLEYNLMVGDLLSQVESVPGYTQKARELAKRYLNQALNGGQNE